MWCGERSKTVANKEMDTLKDFVTILITLVVIMDPLGNLPFFLLFTERNTHAERIRIAGIAAVFACAILVFFGLTGDAILRFLGIGLPAFQIAGGFIFFIYSLTGRRKSHPKT